MNPRKLILLNPYQYPTQSPLTLAAEDMACWLNGYSALWHPAALWGASGPPRVDVSYDHEQPQADHVYALPESPPMFLPDDWEQKVRETGSVCFRATPDRTQTLANLREALAAAMPAGEQGPPPEAALLDVLPDQVAPFLAIGLGYVVSTALSDAMEHENLLEVEDFWQDLQQAIAPLAGLPFTRSTPPVSPSAYDYRREGTDYDEYGNPPPTEDFADAPEPDAQARDQEGLAPSGFEEFADNPEAEAPEATESQPAAEQAPPVEEWQRLVQSAAERLLSAREVLYPVPIYLLDMALLDEDRLDQLPGSFEQGFAVNLIGSSSLLEKLAGDHPDQLARLRDRIASEQAEVCGGCYVEREDALLPLESQLWNLLKGQAVARELLGTEVNVFARRRFGAHPQLPLLLNNAGLTRCLFLTFDEAAVPTYQVPVVNWPSPDGKQVDCFTRLPHPADSAETFFNLAHFLFKTIREDHYATLALLHRGQPASPWYQDWLELSRLAPVLGQWVTFSHFFGQVQAGEFASALSPDEFHHDHLSERVPPHEPNNEGYGGPGATVAPRKPPGPEAKVPVSAFARQARARRRLDTCWTLAALQRGLAGRNDPLRIEERLGALEDQIEQSALGLPSPELAARLAEMEQEIGSALADRLLVRATGQQPGYLILNPCSFTRRVTVEVEGVTTPLPVLDPVKACQLDGGTLRAVVEVPALGFAWIPREGPKGTLQPATRMRLADDRAHVRNEFFEAEIDPTTGGLRGIRDPRTLVNRLAQRLVFNPGSVMRASSIKVTSAGPALGEVVAEGAILGEQEQILARFRQRYRAWLGRPMLELRVEIFPELPARGYPWHAYYGARFAWRDERAVLLRGVGGMGYLTNHVRPQTPDYLELRLARQGTVLFPGGLPFHQRHEGRMLDVILVPEGETAQVFEFGIALDREHPMQTALGMITPVPMVPTTKGPPHVGAKGWLFHLDASNLLLTGMRPGGLEGPPDGEPGGDRFDAVTARLLECASYQSHAELRCARNPTRVALLDARGNLLTEGMASGDAAVFDVAPGDLVQLQVEFDG
ncbi:MAG: hypothetical protein L0Z62_44500 [Gemmataceae bacterium]|nr:hypothetical protein [Gemmataceae bacterium]